MNHSKPITSTTSTTTNRTIYVRHHDPNMTGEGLGSHARGTLYPLLRIAQRFDWEIVWESQSPCWQSNQTRPEYRDECADLGPWLGFVQQYKDLDQNSLTVVPIDLENDQRLGRILGYAGILINSIDEYRQQYGDDVFYCLPSSNRHDDKKNENLQGRHLKQNYNILISLHGRFQYQDDPTASAIQWMQSRAMTWKNKEKEKQQVQQQQIVVQEKQRIKIVAHIRVPEDYCSQEWKDANSVEHVLFTLQTIQQQLDGLDGNYIESVLYVYTESAFSDDNEAILREQWPDLILRKQTPLLDAVQQMATADIFVPGCSYLSAFAGFFQTSLIVLPNEDIRHTKYFAPHLQYNDKNAQVKCPIVRVEDQEAVQIALQKVLSELPVGGE